jgi:hypothetical protein
MYEVIFEIKKYKLIFVIGFIIVFLISFFLKSLYLSYYFSIDMILKNYSSYGKYIEMEFINTVKTMTIQTLIITHIFYGLYAGIKYLIRSSNKNKISDDLLDDNI